MKASLLRPAAVPASARAAPARAIGAATSGPDRRRRRLFQSLAAAARRRLIVSSVVTLSRRHVVSVRARSSGDDEEGNEDFEDDEEFDEDDLLAEFGEDFEGDDEFADDDTTPVEESASRAEASKQQKKQQQPSSAAADDEEEVTERRQDQEKKAKKKKQSSDSEKQSKSKSDASASAADGSSPSTSSLPPAPVRGDAARAYAASAAARAAAGASSASSASDEGEVLEQEEDSFSEGDGEEGYGGDDFGDERTDRALAEAERALQEFLQSGKKDSSSAKGDKKKSKPELLNADLAARALDATAASGDDPKFRAGAGIPDDPFAPREEFDEATGKVKVVPGLPPPRRWLRRVADQGPFDTAKWAVREIKARIDHERAVPFIGNAYISYARLLELLSTRTVTKLTILAGGRCAIVETPVVGFAVDMSYAAAEPGAKEFTALQVRIGRERERGGEFFFVFFRRKSNNNNNKNSLNLFPLHQKPPPTYPPGHRPPPMGLRSHPLLLRPPRRRLGARDVDAPRQGRCDAQSPRGRFGDRPGPALLVGRAADRARRSTARVRLLVHHPE